MAQAVLNVRMDEDVKKALEDFCGEVGMNVSVAVNMFAKAVIREQRLPFEVATQRRLNATTIAAIEDAEAGVGLKRFKTPKDLFAELRED
ncbi:MAG: type II toxin-antitoxin system RelB/DinJ family antitoxin [Oscillospiraceae bacterium]|nr:type II toxin-antitoxin system RelB/DinJ family antitoxin [Oscillospiraceae bacterium]